MKKAKAGIFTLSSSSIIVIESLINIVMIFLDTFLVSQLLKLTPGNYTGVSVFNVLYYLFIALTLFAVSPLLKKMKKGIFISVGAILLAGLFLVVYMLRDNLVNWIWLLGIGMGMSYGCYEAGFNGLMADVVSSKNQTIYFSVKNIVIFIVKTIFPIVLGSLIDFGSFPLMCVVLSVVCALIFIFSFLIKDKQTAPKSFNVIQFCKTVKNGGEETKPLKTLYLSAFFRGFCFDVIATVFVIMLLLSVNGSNADSQVGLFQTIFTATQLIAMFLFMKFYHKRRSPYFIFISIGLIVASAIPVFITFNVTSVLIMFGTYTFLRIFITTVTDMRKTSLIRLLSMHSHSLEHNAVYALIYGLSRASSYLMLLLWMVVPSLTMIYIALGVTLLAYIGYSITLNVLEKQLIIQDINWKKAHPDPQVLNQQVNHDAIAVVASKDKTSPIPKKLKKIDVK